MRTIAKQHGMFPRTHQLLEKCIGDGIEAGINRALDNYPQGKKTDALKEELFDKLQIEILNQVYNWFDVDPEILGE